MSHFDVRVAPRAQAQLDEVAAWWKANRLASPKLVLDEFEAAVLRLRHAPLSGVSYRQSGARWVRRLLLPRSRCHVYYTIEETTQMVNIIAFWHVTRRRGPRLQRSAP